MRAKFRCRVGVGKKRASSEKPEAVIGPNRVFRLLTDASLVQLNFLLCFVPYVYSVYMCTYSLYSIKTITPMESPRKP